MKLSERIYSHSAAIRFPSMSLLEKNQETDQKHGRDAELSMNSPEIQAFFNLVDREAHRFALLNGKNQIPEMPAMENRIVWQPSFIMEDFNIPWNGNSNACHTGKSKDPIQPLTNDGHGGLGEGKEERLKMGLKRARDAFALASNGSQERMKKKTPSNGITCDLNKPDESLDLWSLV